MAQTLYRWLAIAVLAFPTATLANLSQSTILQANTSLNLTTGAVAGSGGDILWDGSLITPQGSAKARNLGALGATSFNVQTESYFEQVAKGASSAPIAAGLLRPGDVFVVVANGGKIAKVLVTANSGSISLQFTTFGVSGVAGVPSVVKVLNNSSLIDLGFPNYGIAPSSLFVVVGSGLADPGTPVLQSSEPPGLPLTLNGAGITVAVNGVTTHPALYYTSPTQLAAVLPAATPVGTGSITVTYKGNTSAPAPIQVVPSALGINTYNTNTGVATDAATGALLTPTNSGTPGEIIVLWTTGLGADPADSDTTYIAAPDSVDTPLQIYVGGVPATIPYQGSSPYPGVNQINLTLPQSLPAGCWVPLVAVAGTVVSNVVTLPIHAGGGECVDTQSGLTGSQISPSGGNTLRTGLVALIQTNSPGSGGTRTITNSTDAAFEKYTGLYTPGKSVSPGGCIVAPVVPVPVPAFTGLDAGTITLTGPAGLSTTLASQFGIKGAFYSALPAGAIPSSGGTFTFKGSGGADVGPFTSTLTLSNLLTWTNQSAAASVVKSQGLQVTWTGGTPGTYVFITGSAASSALGATAGYTCLAPVDAGQFTVPSYILMALPDGNGGTQVQNIIYSSLSASGLDIGIATADVSISTASSYGSSAGK